MFDLTGMMVLVIVISALAYDLWVYRKDSTATISSWVRTMSRDWPIIPFLVGVLVGHFFWYQ